MEKGRSKERKRTKKKKTVDLTRGTVTIEMAPSTRVRINEGALSFDTESASS